MALHFEELWELCEEIHKKNTINYTQSILDELIMKINLYKMIDQKSEIDENEKKKAKFRLYGEILLSFTKLSLIDNINVFDTLMTSYNYLLK